MSSNPQNKTEVSIYVNIYTKQDTPHHLFWDWCFNMQYTSKQ